MGREDVLGEIIHKNISVPATFTRRNPLVGRNSPKQFKGHLYDKRSGKLWKDVYDLGAVEREASKIPPTTFATINDAAEAKRFKQNTKHWGERGNLFTDTPYGPKVLKGEGEFVIPSGHDLFNFTFGSWDNVEENRGTEMDLGKIVCATPKRANKTH